MLILCPKKMCQYIIHRSSEYLIEAPEPIKTTMQCTSGGATKQWPLRSYISLQNKDLRFDWKSFALSNRKNYFSSPYKEAIDTVEGLIGDLCKGSKGSEMYGRSWCLWREQTLFINTSLSLVLLWVVGAEWEGETLSGYVAQLRSTTTGLFLRSLQTIEHCSHHVILALIKSVEHRSERMNKTTKTFPHSYHQ